MNKRERLDKGWSSAREGYTDAFYGKDKSEYYEGVYKVAYLYGQDKFWKEYYENVDFRKGDDSE
jgi:hypothetical protein